MICTKCGTKMEKGWSFCPRCGNTTRKDIFSDIFSKMGRQLKEMDKNIREMDKLFEKDFEVLDISPYFRKPKTSGFSIKIVRSTGKEPKVSVKTFGNVNQEQIRNQLHEQLKTGRGIKIGFRPAPIRKAQSSTAPLAEEPKSIVKREGDKVFVDVEVPGVKSIDNIEITQLQNSVEVRASTKDKSYFKIITIPPQTGLVNKILNKGVLRLEFS